MAEDLQATRRFVHSVKAVRNIKSYFKSWRYGNATSTTTGAAANPGRSQVRGVLRVWDRETTQETRYTRPSGPTETIHLFPGWAVRRYVDDDRNKFDLHVHVSGYATAQRSLGQRAFQRIAKGYAGLNKLAESHTPRSPPTDPRGSDEPKDDEPLQELNEAYELTLENLDVETPELPYTGDDSLHPSSNEPCVSDVLRRWEANLEKRIQIVLGNSMLSSRAVDLKLYVSSHHDIATGSSAPTTEPEELHFVSRHDVLTGADGMFQHEFVINWDDICHHPVGHYSYGQRVEEHELFLHAGLSSPSNREREQSQEGRIEVQVIPITHAPIRVISDIDDTIKFSNILGGARAVFRNVFVHDLEETTIPGMSEWYTKMWEEGVRFHYVSNGPLQMLPLIKAFLQASKLPSGSIRLKSYGARTIFNDLLTPPADRKRDGLDKVLNSFPDSKFILIGDSGEQDLELYAQIARLYPSQILAILVRDVEPDTDPITDATGKEWKRHVMSRNNSESYIPGVLSRSNSVFSSVFRPVRQKSRASSVHDLPTPPPSRSATIDDVSRPQDYSLPTSSTSPAVREPEPITGDGYFNTNLSSSSSSVSPLSEADIESAPIFMRMKPSQNGSRRKKAENPLYKAPEEADKRKPVTMFLDEEPPISQSPEAVSVLKANMNPVVYDSPKPSHKSFLTRTSSTSSATRGGAQNRSPSRSRLPTIDNASTSRLLSRQMRWNTASHPSDSGNQLTSPSIVSLTSKFRGMSESEKKRVDLQERVWRARAETPEHVLLRIFRHPTDCVEVDDLLKNGEF